MTAPLFTIAAISDIHVEKYTLTKEFFSEVNKRADFLLIGGDICNGLPEEAELFRSLISGVHIPVVAILGNHDYDFGDIDGLKKILEKDNLVQVLDGSAISILIRGSKIGLAGTRGFGGGFAPHKIYPRGEVITKRFVEEEEIEVEKLKMACENMRQEENDFEIVMTHYAAFSETIEGEPKELYLCLGSSKLGDVIATYKPTLSLSGHAHHGSSGIKKAREEGVLACNIAYKVNDGRISYFDVSLVGEVSQSY